jgi:hypothetical protein
VLAAVLVTLQADALSGSHQQPFHLVALAAAEAFEPAPGPLDPFVLVGAWAGLVL